MIRNVPAFGKYTRRERMGNNSLVLTKRMAQAIIKEGVIHNMELFNDLTSELKQATDDPEAKALLNRLNLIKISTINKASSAPAAPEKPAPPVKEEEAIDEVENEPPSPPVKSAPPVQKPVINMAQKPIPQAQQNATVKAAPVEKPVVKEEVSTEAQEKPAKKKMSMGILIAIGVVVVLIVVGVIWFFMNYRIVA
jgi:cobalamin biosynthesis Mg chelatase CobN